MKYSLQASHFIETKYEENETFSRLSSIFAKSKSGFIAKKFSEKTRRNFNPFIPLCQYEGLPETMTFETCDLFNRGFTNMGLGYSFNANSFTKMYQQTEYNTLFKKIMFPSQNDQVRHPGSSGPDYRLRFVLNGDSEAVKQYEKAKDYTKVITEFTLGIHDPSEPANLRADAIKVRTGYETTILITPKVILTTAEAEKMSFTDRQCWKRSESSKLKIFKEYSRNACLLECALDEANR